MADQLKQRGNEAFQANDFVNAEVYYRKAIEDFGPTQVLLSNKAAALIQLGKFQEAIEDCDHAIQLDPTWTKAYFRKATALEKSGNMKACYLTWLAASEKCEYTTWLRAQLQTALSIWKKIYKTEVIDSTDDFLARYKLLNDTREKLSTMAHFWNASTPEERLQHFHFLLGLIGGGGKISDYNQSITAEVLPFMPMDNYRDLPREGIEAWVIFYEKQNAEEKTNTLKGMWDQCSSVEQSTIITDLRLFISQELEKAAALGNAGNTNSDKRFEEIDA